MGLLTAGSWATAPTVALHQHILPLQLLQPTASAQQPLRDVPPYQNAPMRTSQRAEVGARCADTVHAARPSCHAARPFCVTQRRVYRVDVNACIQALWPKPPVLISSNAMLAFNPCAAAATDQHAFSPLLQSLAAQTTPRKHLAMPGKLNASVARALPHSMSISEGEIRQLCIQHNTNQGLWRYNALLTWHAACVCMYLDAAALAMPAHCRCELSSEFLLVAPWGSGWKGVASQLAPFFPGLADFGATLGTTFPGFGATLCSAQHRDC